MAPFLDVFSDKKDREEYARKALDRFDRRCASIHDYYIEGPYSQDFLVSTETKEQYDIYDLESTIAEYGRKIPEDFTDISREIILLKRDCDQRNIEFTREVIVNGLFRNPEKIDQVIKESGDILLKYGIRL